jgi:outer membrane protein assembly factor BamB
MKNRKLCKTFSIFLLSILTISPLSVAENMPQLIRSNQSPWPQFRGPSRDGVSNETGLLRQWPTKGPKLIWKASGLGLGYSSPIVVNDAIYITGDVDDELAVFAFDHDGSLLWKTSNGNSWEKPWPGARSTCTFYKDRLYHENAHGRVAALDPQTGKELWAVNILDRFDGENIKWALSECLLVDDDKVYVTPGGKKAFMAALNAETGETLWQSPPLEFTRTYIPGGETLNEPVTDIDKAGYASPILFRMGDRKIIARTSGQHAICIDAETGEFLWKHKIYARFDVIGAIPVLANDTILFAAPDDFGSTMFKLNMENNILTAKMIWHTPLDNCHGAMVHVDGSLFGSGYRKLTDWACIDAATGRIKYSKDDLTKGTCIFADDRLYALAEDGNFELLKPTGAGFETAGSIKLTEEKRRDVWAHPVICNGRLYLRDHENLWCYDIKK